MRATICVNKDHNGEAEVVEAWFERWRSQLNFVSENQGCGCCVNMWDVEGPAEAVAQLPETVKAASEWAGYD